MLPYGRQTIEDDDIAAVAEALRADFLTTGPKVQAFEDAFAAKVGAGHAVACSNGTAALHLAMLALDVKPGEVCIAPAVTFLATANCARYVGADVIFADVDPDTGLMRPEDLAEALTRCEAHAVMNVHLAGQIGDVVNIHKVAREAGLRIIEDACHAVGTTYLVGNHTHRAGDNAFADLTCFSFHPVKPVTTGEGGVVTTNDDDLAARLRTFRTHGITRTPEHGGWAYEVRSLGGNYRLIDFALQRHRDASIVMNHFRRIREPRTRQGQPKQAHGKAGHPYTSHQDVNTHTGDPPKNSVRGDTDEPGQPAVCPARIPIVSAPPARPGWWRIVEMPRRARDPDNIVPSQSNAESAGTTASEPPRAREPVLAT